MYKFCKIVAQTHTHTYRTGLLLILLAGMKGILSANEISHVLLSLDIRSNKEENIYIYVQFY